MNRTKRLTGVCTECGGSIEFQAELVGTMTRCPRCGKQTELRLAAPPEEPAVPRKAIVWTGITIVILVAAVIGLVLGLDHYAKLAARKKEHPQAVASGEAAEAAARAGFEVTTISLEPAPDDTVRYAVGTVVNKLARKRSGVVLELDLLDAAGKTVEIARNYRPDLGPGAQWAFKVTVGDPKVASVKLAAVKEGP